MKISVSNIAWNYNSRNKFYKLLKKEKIAGLEIAPKIFLSNHKNYLNPHKELLKKNLDEIYQNNLQLVSMQALLYESRNCYLFRDQKSLQNFEDIMKKTILLSKILGIQNIVFGSPKNRNIPKNLNIIDAKNIALKTFRKLANYAKKNKVVISIEAVPKLYGTNFLNNNEQVYDFIKKINSPNVKMVLDTGEINVNNDLSKINLIVKKMINHVNHIQISQPYLKKINNVSYLSNFSNLLKKYKYNKWISIEMRRTRKSNFKNVKESIRIVKRYL